MSENLYEQLGGEAGLRNLVLEFYQAMDQLPEAQKIRQMHPPDLSESVEKLYLFLSGWSGGPALYVEKFGHPMLRRRHFPFSIAEPERDAWIVCMRHALEKVGLQEPLLSSLLQSFYRVADHMRNQ